MKQREIKFMAWNGKGMTYFNLNHTGLRGLTRIMQFIGIKDKNGKEIYEGDIFRVKYSYPKEEMVGVVIFEKGKYVGYRHRKAQNVDLFHTEDLEIIGNTFESPGLLGKQNDT